MSSHVPRPVLRVANDDQEFVVREEIQAFMKIDIRAKVDIEIVSLHPLDEWKLRSVVVVLTGPGPVDEKRAVERDPRGPVAFVPIPLPRSVYSPVQTPPSP
jgi:hypothetical protein